MSKKISQRKGIILAGGKSTRLYPATFSITKQLLPIYDKPMIYYPLSILMLSKINDILIISTPDDIGLYEKLLGNGSRFGIRLSYLVQTTPKGLADSFIVAEKFLDGSEAALILGDNLFYGNNLSNILYEICSQKNRNTIFGFEVSNPTHYGVIEFDKNDNIVSIEEKPKKPKSNYAVTGLYFYDNTVCERAKLLRPSERGELEITDLNNSYIRDDSLDVKKLGRGFAWLDTGTHNNLLEASHFVSIVEKRTGIKIGCIEEIAFNNSWIDELEIKKSIDLHKGTNYGEYLKKYL